MAELVSGPEHFTATDMYTLSDLVASAWTAAADCDWTTRAGPLEWSCLATADHAVDCVYAPAFFLASRRTDAYPRAGNSLALGPDATPARLVESLAIATRTLVAIVNDAEPDVRAVIFRRPEIITGAPPDFLPRAAVELALHAHDVSTGLDLPFEPPADLCSRLREHTRPWPMWTIAWNGLPQTNDPWRDLLQGSGRC
jgi:hypothetical protein